MGIDFAASATRTAIVVLESASASDHIMVLRAGLDLDDDGVVAAVRHATTKGVDVPFGWPDDFVDVVAVHRNGTLRTPEDSGRGWCKSLTHRATDREMVRVLGIHPLSVSADRIGHAALRWAAVAARLARDGTPVARDGTSGVCEVYPAASLRSWELTPLQYEGAGRTAERETLLSAIEKALGAIDWQGLRGRVVAQEDVFDAFICALTAAAMSRQLTATPPERDVALREGWVHVPTHRLAALIPALAKR